MTPTTRRVIAAAWVAFATAVSALLIVAVVLAAFGTIKPPSISRVEDQLELTADARRYICDKVNELPAKLGQAIALSDQLRAITGRASTTLPLALTPEEQARVDALQAELAAVVHNLGSPIDCERATSGTTSPTTTSPRQP